jgi:hypothetical protein
MSKRDAIRTAILAVLTLSAVSGLSADEIEQHHAHEHGKVTINLAIERDVLSLELEMPALHVVGFEHAPRTDAERRAVADAERWLRAGRSVLGVPKAAACRIEQRSVETPAWQDSAESHSDYEARYSFRCGQPAQLKWVELWLLDRLREVTDAELNLIDASGQRTQTVSHARERIPLR